jgi:predicted ATP-grasp superfamily ATP-dependent carboligase
VQAHTFLILAQSGRFLAQQLQFTGHPIWVADCFGDSDTLTACSHWLKLDSIDKPEAIQSLLKQLPSDMIFNLICGSGIESFYPVLENLPSHIHLIGNKTDTIRQLRTPELFFNQLLQLNIPHPETRFTRPKAKNTWLIKSATGLGGTHINFLDEQVIDSNHYFQRYEAGISGSALIVANGQSAQILSLNKHYLSTTKAMPFRLVAIDNSLTIDDKQQRDIELYSTILTQYFGLLGLNSIDFIMTEDGRLLITEINPRPSASAELLTGMLNPIQLHLKACRGQLPTAEMNNTSHQKACLIYHFAPRQLTINTSVQCPKNCFDRPVAHSIIESQQIICTSVLKNCHYSRALHLQRDQLVWDSVK